MAIFTVNLFQIFQKNISTEGMSRDFEERHVLCRREGT